MLRATAIVVALSGCMVGDPDPVSQDPTDQPETADESPATTPIALTVSDGLDAEERVFLQQINDYRIANNLAPLQVSVALTNASDVHAKDMAAKNYFSHDSQDGTTWIDRIKRYYVSARAGSIPRQSTPVPRQLERLVEPAALAGERREQVAVLACTEADRVDANATADRLTRVA